MAKFRFSYPMHDEYGTGERRDILAYDQGLPPEVATAIAEQRPFYEVVLQCEYDELTGEVTIVAARRQGP